MNELIEDYAIECAGQMVWDFPKDPEEFTFTRDELAKFAQLIVEECAQACVRTGVLEQEDDDYNESEYLNQLDDFNYVGSRHHY